MLMEYSFVPNCTDAVIEFFDYCMASVVALSEKSQSLTSRRSLQADADIDSVDCW